MTYRPTARGLGMVLGAASIATIASVATVQAHDEDILKLLDFSGAVEGPIYHGTPPGQFGARSGPFAADGINLATWIPLNNFPGNPQSGNDCWGYVSGSGREYAIMGLYNGYSFVEVTDPYSATQVDFVSGPGSLWHDVKVIGDYAYGVSEGGSGIQVMDLSDIDNGNVTLVRNDFNSGHSSTHNIAANTDTGYLYLCGANISNGGLVALNTNDPTNPTIEGAWTTAYVHDAQVVSYTSGPYAGREIAFCFTGSTGRMHIVDVTNKSNMFTMSSISWSGNQYSHQGWVSEDGLYVYLNDEIDEGNTVSVTTTRVFDVSNLSSPQFRGTFTTGLPSTDHNLYIHDGIIYEANYRSGLRVFDASNPLAPTEIAYIDTFPNSNSSGYEGAWSVYPYFPSGTVIISDMNRGLFVVEVDLTRMAFEFPGGVPETLDPQASTEITTNITVEQGTLDTSSAQLHYSVNGGPEQTVAMTHVSGDEFTVTLPGQSCFSEVDYWFSASTFEGSTGRSPSGAPNFVYEANVMTGETVIASHNFNTNPGWVASNLGASSGDWQRGVPVNDSSWDYDPQSDSDGSGQCWLTQNQFGNTDVDGGSVRLTTSGYDLSGVAGPVRITYDYFLRLTDTGGGVDRLLVEINTNGGVGSWTEIARHDTDGGLSWRTHEISQSDLDNAGVTLSDDVRLRFTANDSDPQSINESGIDAFSIIALTCEEPPTCLADWNGDGSVGTNDFLAYLNDYNAVRTGGSPTYNDPDLTDDGSINTADFIEFLNIYNGGC